MNLDHQHSRVSDSGPAPAFPPAFGGMENAPGTEATARAAAGEALSCTFQLEWEVGFLGCHVRSPTSTAHASTASLPAGNFPYQSVHTEWQSPDASKLLETTPSQPGLPLGHTMAIPATKQAALISTGAVTHSEYADVYAKGRGLPTGKIKLN